MIQLNNPLDETVFDKQDSVLLDACILLSLIDDEEKFYDSCKSELEKLKSKCVKFYVSNVVLAEVINRTINNLFITDIQFIWNGNILLNSKENIKNILNIMNEQHYNMLIDSSIPYNDIIKIPYTRYFNKISKNKTVLNRNVLSIYYSEAIRIVDELIDIYELNTLVINENMMNIAKNYTKVYCLGINDSQHLATAIGHRIKYLMTSDNDFSIIPEELKVKLIKIA